MLCAARAAQSGNSVVLLEHNNVPGKKIRISGGGRCNFTNIHTTHKNFISHNPEFARSALSRYTPRDFIDLVERYNIAWHEKALGQLFCDGSAQQIIDLLVQECRLASAECRMNVRIHSIAKSEHFQIETDKGLVEAHNVVVATGGLSIPSLGASDIGYRIAKHFAVPIVQTLPALVPLTFDERYKKRFGELSGVSAPVRVSTKTASFDEAMLFTHRGISGPSILQISSYLDKGDPFTIDLLPYITADDLFNEPNREPRSIASVLTDHLPKRLVQAWSGVDLQRRVDQTSKLELREIVNSLKNWSITPAGTEGYAKAEVTRGGVDTDALSSKTMECRSVKGLYFIGEVVDVTGWLGGYNFQWAWSSAEATGSDLRRP